MTDRRLVLIGEDPGKGDPRCPLYPLPAGRSGARLCDLLGMSAAEYANETLRVNVFYATPARWDADEARARVLAMGGLLDRAAVVACGRRVATALGLPESTPWYSARRVKLGVARAFVMPIPHPSGRCRVWNEAGESARARAALGLMRRASASPSWMSLTAPYEEVSAETFDELHAMADGRGPIEPPRLNEHGRWTIRVIPRPEAPLCTTCGARAATKHSRAGRCVYCAVEASGHGL